MAQVISIDPVTRIEGHLKVETRVANGRVSDVKVMGQMYRGFERLLQGRHPVDAARIAQRICGVCHEVHGVSSVMALEEIYGVTPPKNGLVLRDLILGLHIVTDHLLHFYHLCSPDYIHYGAMADYIGSDSRLQDIRDWVTSSGTGFISTPPAGNVIRDMKTVSRYAAHYFDTIKIRSQAAGGIALLGGKAPFIHALLPGGITSEITADSLMKYYSVLTETARFVRDAYVPDVMELAQRYPEYFSIGEAHNAFYANSSFDLLGTPLFKAGVAIDGVTKPFDYGNVRELLSSSFYDETGRPDATKSGAYSWIKSPRYGESPLEVGPLARLILNKDQDFRRAMSSLGQKELKSSVMGRLVARAVEAEKLCDHLFALLEAYTLGEPTIHPVDLQAKVSGEGIGFSVAARGALIHHIVADKGKVVNYTMIVPSTWNFGPTVGRVRGVVEEAVMNTPVQYSSHDSIEVGRVIRSFDPCTACSVH